MKRLLIGTVILWASGALCAAIAAQENVPQTTNTKLEVRDAGGNLGATIQQLVAASDGPMWIGYEVEEIPGRDGDCCNGNFQAGNGGSGTFQLENEHGSNVAGGSGSGDVKLEGARELMILLRAEKGRVEKIRFLEAACRLDAGGLRLVWLKEAKAPESVAYLSGIVKAGEFSSGNHHGMEDEALTAIAQHADGAADRALEGFAAAGQPQKLREKASFWMGAARGEAGFKALQKMARTEPDDNVRAQVSFDLFVSKEPAATDEIIRMAREDASPHVRGQALFWLAQKAGQKAEKTITGAIADDPDTEVKKKAVFALSQMPKDEGVPRLIEVAEKNKNPEVRKQAMFWLGQSGDPRALAFFEKVLEEKRN
jgi:HEAT repeats